MEPKPRGRPREFDTEAALDVAVALFWQKGYEAVGVAELCREMGIAKQSLYDWVGDKKGLYVASIERYMTTHICGLEDNLSQEGSPIANLRHCLHAIADYAKMPGCNGCLLTNAESEFGTSDEAIRGVTERVEEFIVRSFCGVLERARSAGEIDPALDCEAMASALAVFRNGLMVAGRAGQSAKSIDQTIALVEAMLKAR